MKYIPQLTQGLKELGWGHELA